MLSQEVAARIRAAAADAGKSLDGKLPPLPDHPVRNPYAHIWREVKNRMGVSYNQCSDEDEQKILDIIRETAENPR